MDFPIQSMQRRAKARLFFRQTKNGRACPHFFSKTDNAQPHASQFVGMIQAFSRNLRNIRILFAL
jgi:hypothetical protein